MNGLTFRQPANFGPIAFHHGFFLFPAPAFDLPFRGKRFFAGNSFLGPNALDGKTRCGIAAAFTGYVLGHAFFEIVGMAGVITAVGAAKNVNPEHSASLPLFEVL